MNDFLLGLSEMSRLEWIGFIALILYLGFALFGGGPHDGGFTDAGRGPGNVMR